MADTTRTITEAFFRAFCSQGTRLHTVRTKDTPSEMVIAERGGGWVDWRLIPGDGRLASILDQLQHEAGVRLPPSFLHWYSSYFTLRVDLGILTLPANPINTPGRHLRTILLSDDHFSRKARDRGLIPFGDEGLLDAGPLCFDPTSDADSDRWAVRYWDHEWEGTEAEVGPVIFSSFERLLVATTAFMDTFEISPGADQTRANREACLRALVSADPHGAGGPGLDYWFAELDEV